MVAARPPPPPPPPPDTLRYAAVTSVAVDVPLSAVPWLSVDTFLWTR